jgi:hypothetical protein
MSRNLNVAMQLGLAAITATAPVSASSYSMPRAACETIVAITDFVFEAKPPNGLTRDFTHSLSAFARPIGAAADACEGPRRIEISTDADMAALNEIAAMLAAKGIALDPTGPLLEVEDRRPTKPAQ